MDRGGQSYFSHRDDLYNVVGLVDAATGQVVERYTYDDYGTPTVWVEDGENPGAWVEHTTANGAPASAIGNPFLFTGRRWDPQLQLYDYRTRYYDPALGRFLRIDTIGLYGDPNNLGNPYAYLGNNPWSGVDPWGQWGWDDDWVETSVSILTGGLVGEGGSAAAHSFWVESGGEQLRGMASGAAALFDKEARSQFHDDNAQRFYERIMMHHTEGEDIEDAISSATGLGVLTSDFVGTTQIMEAYDALDYSTGDSLEGVERTQRGLIGVSQMAAAGAIVGGAASATNSAASRLVGNTTNTTIARGAGLATTRIGPGFGARAATRMRVAGNLAASRAGNASSGFSNWAAEEAVSPTAHPTCRPGPYAGESIAARSASQTFTAAERAAVNRIGAKTGCHTCGRMTPGTRSGNWVPDHQPVSALNHGNATQRLYPQCIKCSRAQGGQIRAALRKTK